MDNVLNVTGVTQPKPPASTPYIVELITDKDKEAVLAMLQRFFFKVRFSVNIISKLLNILYLLNTKYVVNIRITHLKLVT